MSDPFVDVGILDNLLNSPNLTLASKRAMLCVNRLFREATRAHLSQGELHVDWIDCTIHNARFILNVLIPRVPGLLVCARDEAFAPKMDLAALARLTNVRVMTPTCIMGATAAYFLGHALAHSDGYVRLTMGRRKSLKALRERSRIWLDDYEQSHPIDCLLVSGALLANAEARIKEFDGETLDLSALYLSRTAMRFLAGALHDAFDACTGPFVQISLTDNPIGSAGVEAIVDALCSRRRCDPVVVDCLELQKTGVSTRGIEKLVAPMWGGGLRIKTLFLNDCSLDDAAVETLVRALGQAWLDYDDRGHEKPLRTDGIRTLDLSGNSFGERGITALLDTRWSAHLRSLYVCALRGVPKRCYVELCRQVREGIYPKIELIVADTGTARSKQAPIEEAVAYWDWQRKLRANADEWERYQKEFKREEAQKKKVRDASRAREALAVVDSVVGFNVAAQV